MFICHCQFFKIQFLVSIVRSNFFFFTHSLSCLPLFFFRKTTWPLGICFYYCLDHSRKNCGCSSARRIPKVILWRGKLFTLGCCIAGSFRILLLLILCTSFSWLSLIFFHFQLFFFILRFSFSSFSWDSLFVLYTSQHVNCFLVIKYFLLLLVFSNFFKQLQ